MKKHIIRTALVLFAALICMVFSSCGKDETAFTMSGVQMSVNDFKSYYSGEKKLDECTSKKDAQVGLSNISAEEGYLSFYLMSHCDGNYNLGNFLGQLFADQTLKDAGVNATVGYLSDTAGNFSVLLFQIYNGDEPDDTLLVNKDLSGKAHLKVYLTDSSNNLYFFEGELPETLKGISNGGLEAVSAYDKWYATFFGTETEVEG